jgi:hypothetical protein
LDGVTGEYYETEDMDGEPIDLDEIPGKPVVFTRGVVVMFREQAEQEDREILGPAENTPPGVDAVRVRSERYPG